MFVEPDKRPQAEPLVAPSHQKPTLSDLAYLLRHPELWPPHFVWNFAHCQSCAMALAFRKWNASRPTPDRPVTIVRPVLAGFYGVAARYNDMTLTQNIGEMSEMFDICHTDAVLIFGSFVPYHTSAVTSVMVATVIESYLRAGHVENLA